MPLVFTELCLYILKSQINILLRLLFLENYLFRTISMIHCSFSLLCKNAKFADIYFYFSAILRECFPISVLLGNLNDPLTPEDECIPRDISEPGTTGNTSLNTKQWPGDGAVGEGKWQSYFKCDSSSFNYYLRQRGRYHIFLHKQSFSFEECQSKKTIEEF